MAMTDKKAPLRCCACTAKGALVSPKGGKFAWYYLKGRSMII